MSGDKIKEIEKKIDAVRDNTQTAIDKMITRDRGK